MTKKALLIIDVQNDFLPGGSLAVDDGHAIIPIINKIHENIKWDLVVLSQDWHPKGHKSFSSSWAGEKDIKGNTVVAGQIQVIKCRGPEEVLWPDHCVQESFGAKFHTDLKILPGDVIVKKGTDPEVDSYSAFADNNQNNLTELYSILDSHNIEEVYVCGIATDYCVNFTCKDANERKDKKNKPFKTFLIVDACRGVDKVGSEKAVVELQQSHRVIVTSSTDVLGIVGQKFGKHS